MKEGWTLAIGEYHDVTIFIKHGDILENCCETILCPYISPEKIYEVTEKIMKAACINTEVLPSIQAGMAKDLSTSSLRQTKVIVCGLESIPIADQVLQAFKAGLEISNSLGCTSSAIPVFLALQTLESSAEALMESIESFILENLGQTLAIKEIHVFASSLFEIRALLDVCKFRMTRYSSFLSIGLPLKENIPGRLYCFDCCKMYDSSTRHNC